VFSQLTTIWAKNRPMGTGCFAVFCLKRSEPAATGMQPCWLTLQQHPGDSEEEMGKVKKKES